MQDYKPWGKLVSINLHECDFDKLSNPEMIKAFVVEIIVKIGMKAHGEIQIDRFGYGELEGYSAMQFIETSSITVHCDEVGRRCFVDIFSCKDFDEKKAEKFSEHFFGAKGTMATTLVR